MRCVGIIGIQMRNEAIREYQNGIQGNERSVQTRYPHRIDGIGVGNAEEYATPVHLNRDTRETGK